MEPDKRVELSGGEVVIAAKDGSIHCKCATSHGDPVELTSEEAREMAAHLLRLADLVE